MPFSYLSHITHLQDFRAFAPTQPPPNAKCMEFGGGAWLQKQFFSKKTAFTDSLHFRFSKWGDAQQGRGAKNLYKESA